MALTRRAFLGLLPAGWVGLGRRPGSAPQSTAVRAPRSGFDPWVEVESAALRQNVRTVAGLAGGRPVLAVVKNNAYGLGLELVASVLDPLPEIAGFAVVKADAALRLQSTVNKPVLLMGLTPADSAEELVRAGVRLSFFTERDIEAVSALSSRLGGPVPGHHYVDSGMGRMGVPDHGARAWMQRLAATGATRIEGTFMAFTEDPDFDPEQLERFLSLTDGARASGLSLGSLHAASSNGVYHLPAAHLDLVRPGIAIFGAYPSRPDEERAKAELAPAVRLKARVVRVIQLRAGDSVSYGRNYVAERPTWVATLPVGHSDGYTRRAVDGARVLIGGRTYPVIGAVSASHTIVEVGAEPSVRVGDEATLLGPDHPEIHPNALAAVTGTSVYDALMHLSPALPRVLI